MMSGGLVAAGCTSDDNAAPGSGDSGAPPGDDSSVPFDAGPGADASNPATDAGPDATPDAQPDGATAACDQTKPFGTPALAPYTSGDFDDFAARLSADQLTMYIQSNRDGVSFFGTIDVLTRATKSGTFAGATPLAVANFAGSANEKPSISTDGLTLFTDSSYLDEGGNNPYIFKFTRPTAPGTFGAGVQVDLHAPSVDTWDVSPFITADGATLYFSSTRTADSSLGGFTAAVLADGGFDTPKELTELDVAGTITGNLLPSADGLTIYFFSNRGVGDAAPASNDIYVARRAHTTDPFGAPALVAELATAQNDEPSWLSPDTCTLWFMSQGQPDVDGGASTHARIYQATRPK